MDRNKIIIKTSAIGIITNIVLVIFKGVVGFFTNSIAIILDALNNLTDILSATITIVGTKLSNKAPDKKHPYGHGRIEYFTSIVISTIILLAGIAAGKESISKILFPVKVEYTIVSLIIVTVAVLTKYVLSKYVKKVGYKVNSQSLIATGQDAFMDAILSFTTLVAGVLNFVWKYSIEGYLGFIISLVIIRSAIQLLSGNLNLLLGERADKDLTTKLKDKIMTFEDVQGVYDLNLHNYGPTKIIASVHIQVRSDMTAKEIHILTRDIEYKVYEEFGIALTIGIYAANDEGEYKEIKLDIENIVKEYPSILQIHGFYVDEANHSVYFDVIFDFDEENKERIINDLVQKLKEKYNTYDFNVIIDSDITD